MATVGPHTGYERRRRVEQLTQSDIKRHRPTSARSLRDAIIGGTAISRRESRALGQPHSGPVSRLHDALDAVDEFRVRRLFLSDALAAAGYYCREHHLLGLEGGRRPFHGSALLPTENVVDELVEFTQQDGVDLMLVVRRQDMLDTHGRIAAVLYPAA